MGELVSVCSQLEELLILLFNYPKPNEEEIPAIKLSKLMAFMWGDAFAKENSSIPALKTFISQNTQMKRFSYYTYNSSQLENLPYYLPVPVSF